jgi:hypothetical protein
MSCRAFPRHVTPPAHALRVTSARASRLPEPSRGATSRALRQANSALVGPHPRRPYLATSRPCSELGASSLLTFQLSPGATLFKPHLATSRVIPSRPSSDDFPTHHRPSRCHPTLATCQRRSTQSSPSLATTPVWSSATCRPQRLLDPDLPRRLDPRDLPIQPVQRQPPLTTCLVAARLAMTIDLPTPLTRLVISQHRSTLLPSRLAMPVLFRSRLAS